MRLLQWNDDDDFSFLDFYGDWMPEYAILSHTWEMDEVTFEDIIKGAAKTKSGYKKIRFCAEQARRDGLRYFWVDTCCINKTSSAELSEAINSMFNWYAQATLCYVCLSDVFIPNHENSEASPQGRWTESFQGSRWFTRGWTLQELIAPQSLRFYAADGSKLGTKQPLKALVSEITGIPPDILDHSKRPDEYSVPERMAWASTRKTTRTEDRAYCLLGLFDVKMPLLYGEGEHAFQRLQREIMTLTNQTSGLRLLHVQSSPLLIETFPTQEHPEYAILSHTWTTSEVSFQDVLLGKAPTRRGYQKIKNCCKQAARDGFKYVWVDTCCIDKTSSAELQEAICSMYKWYENAKKCYVYLEDYDLKEDSTTPLRSCRWFTRGWTLQELIAPLDVEFYDSKWTSFGTKNSLHQLIANITGIDAQVLLGSHPHGYTVAERMAWASNRTTTRVEDAAYSLMGLFDVFMPMLYGEGSRAFMRLQEEIMKKSEDYSIFAWQSSESRYIGIFAQSPSQFNKYLRVQDNPVENVRFYSHSMHFASRNMHFYPRYLSPTQALHNPAVITSRGLLITLPLLKIDVSDVLEVKTEQTSQKLMSGQHVSDQLPLFRRFKTPQKSENLVTGTYLALICPVESGANGKEQIICVWLRKARIGVFLRESSNKVVLLPKDKASQFDPHTIYIHP